MCIYRRRDTSREKRCPHGREHMERAVQKNHGRERSSETDDAGGGAQQRIGPTRTGVTIETAAPRCAIVNATSNDWITLVMRSAILWLKTYTDVRRRIKSSPLSRCGQLMAFE